MNHTKLLQSALDALRGYRQEHGDAQPCDTERAIEAALAEQQAAEPVAWGLGNTAITGSNRWMMLREQVPADDQYGGAMWTPLYTQAPTQQPLTILDGYKLVPVERSYDMRVQAILHFNTALKAGADRDDCLEAAWRATLAAAHGITGSKT